jgi:hypothetical protein
LGKKDEADGFARQTRFDSPTEVQRRPARMCREISSRWRFQRTITMTSLKQTFGKVIRE